MTSCARSERPRASRTMASDERGADVCLIVEGGYPYVVGGVASWSDALMRASPQLTFHVLAISIASQSQAEIMCFPPTSSVSPMSSSTSCPRGRTPTAERWEQDQADVFGLWKSY